MGSAGPKNKKGKKDNTRKERETQYENGLVKRHKRFYETLKESCVSEIDSSANPMHFEPSDPTDDKITILQKIIKIANSIKFQTNRNLNYYANLGDELANFKKSVAFCTACQDLPKYDALSCAICIKKRFTNTFYNEIKNAIGVGKAQILLYIRVAKIAHYFPKFKQTNLSLSAIGKHLTFLLEKMPTDADWWQ